jgi:hypothetical protein
MALAEPINRPAPIIPAMEIMVTWRLDNPSPSVDGGFAE